MMTPNPDYDVHLLFSDLKLLMKRERPEDIKKMLKPYATSKKYVKLFDDFLDLWMEVRACK